MADKAPDWIEKRFADISKYLGEQISRFVAFLFLLFAIGAFFGAFVYTNFPDIAIYLLVAPLILGIIAYYSKTFALILFLIFMAFFVF